MSDDLKNDILATLRLARTLAQAARDHRFLELPSIAMVHEKVGDIEGRVRAASIRERGAGGGRFEAEQFNLPMETNETEDSKRD